MENTSVFAGEKLLEVESKSGLFDLKVNDVYLWQYVRFSCLVKILEEITGVETVCREGRITKSGQEVQNPKEWLQRQQFLARKKDILVLNHPRRVKEGNYFKCFVTDEILKNLDYSYYVYEREYNGLHYKPAKTKYLKYININIIREIFKYDEEKNKKQLSAFAKRIIYEFERNCQMEMSKNLKQYIFSSIFSTYENLFYYKIWAKIILKLVRPKLLMVTVGYHAFIQTMVAEAKKRHIPTVELQHARIGDTHLAYNYIYRGKLESFADYMFVYGNYDKSCPRFPIEEDHVIAVGYPELEKKANYYSRHKKNNKRKVITFLSAPSPENVILKYALELRKNQKLKDYRIIYKLHPCEYNDWKTWYPELENSGLEVISNNLHDIYYYLGHSDYVAGISSTVLFEAIEFNTQIFVIKDGDYRKAEYLYQNDYACLVESSDRLVEAIVNPVEKRQVVRENEYFKMNGMQNIRNEIKRILEI